MPKTTVIDQRAENAKSEFDLEKLRIQLEANKTRIEHYKAFLIPFSIAVPVASAVVSILFTQSRTTDDERIEFMKLISESGADKSEIIRTWNALYPDKQWLNEDGTVRATETASKAND